MEINDMTIEEIETRCAEISELLTGEDANVEELTKEVEQLEARKSAILTEVENRNKIVEAVMNGEGEVKETFAEEARKDNKMELNEIRSSQEYVNAYAEWLKNSLVNGKADETELRALLSDAVTVSGTAGVPTPTLVEERIRTAWEKDDILSRVRKTFIKGNLKVGFELSATEAVVHTEGAAAPTEETLNIGVVTLVPQTLKKWISVSDEVLDMHGQEFLDYIFDEIEYRIVKLAADKVVADIVGSPTTADADEASVANLAISAASIHDFVDAEALLSDEASNLVIIMNKASYATYKGLQMAANYAVDPFDGIPVIFNNSLYAAASATSGQAIAIVGDLDGAQCNFPNGYAPTFKYDELSLAEKDLVKIVGRLPVAHDVTACGRFCVIKKSA